MKVLFLFPYPHATAASQRFRFEQYLDFLNEEGIEYKLASFLDEKTWKILYKPGHTISKAIGIAKGFFKRTLLLFSINQFSVVFIHREASPIGPPIFEWLIAKVFRKKIVFDFDDAIWLPNTSANNKIAANIKWHGKTKSICKWAYKVSAGNNYLAQYASCFNKRVAVNPTTIDTIHLHNRIKNQQGCLLPASEGESKIVIGWTGTHSTMSYLHVLLPVLEELEKEHSFTFLVIADKEPLFKLSSLQFLPWNKSTEIDDLLKMNIGVMPLVDDLWAKGKCGFKALQYMALGIPALVSPVGVNCEIVEDGVNGFVCNSKEEWKESLATLLKDTCLRKKMGLEARKQIEQSYSVQANRRTFLGLFTD